MPLDPHTRELVKSAIRMERKRIKERINNVSNFPHLWTPNDKKPILGVNEGDDRRDRPYVVVRRVGYRHALLGVISIENGFTTDLGSIPWLLKAIPGYRPTDPGMRAFLLHDWCYRKQLADRHLCDVLMKDALIADGMSRWKAWICYVGVRLGGRKAYAAHTKPDYDRHFREGAD